MATVTLDGVNKIYENGFQAIHDLSLDIEDGEFLVLVGPSGCGKSTALRMIAGLESISGGVMKIGDRVVNDVEPKDRDIAMVFQNYALYPHMTVFDNMGFGLKLQKMQKPEISRRVREAARILGLDELLDRKPRALSGGQRQRVAMGRAIVRNPQAYLMDEPLSNLDAKLRVQTRAEIARIQHELGVTTIYVTHDQTEAMTMGDRVAVLRKGTLQQVDTPQTLYEMPVNIFVAGFIGSPAMNLVEGELRRLDDGLVVDVGGFRLPIPAEVEAARPDLRNYVDRTIVLGVRPEDMEDAALVTDAPAERRIAAIVELRESLGSDVLVHFTIEGRPPITEDVKELVDEVGEDILQQVEQQAQSGRAPMIARLSPRTTVRKGDPIELVVDTHRLHFFDLDHGSGIYGQGDT